MSDQMRPTGSSAASPVAPCAFATATAARHRAPRRQPLRRPEPPRRAPPPLNRAPTASAATAATTDRPRLQPDARRTSPTASSGGRTPGRPRHRGPRRRHARRVRRPAAGIRIEQLRDLRRAPCESRPCRNRPSSASRAPPAHARRSRMLSRRCDGDSSAAARRAAACWKFQFT